MNIFALLTRPFLMATFVAALYTLTPSLAYAVGNLSDITIIDRDTYQTLPLTWHKGQYYVAGRPGARYAISVRNSTGERLLAVMSVDGVNIISGETAGVDQTGYVFGAGESSEITGWRKSQSRVAAFEFTALSNSYAARTGRPDQVGVIGVALFRERSPVAIAPAPLPPCGRWNWRRCDRDGREQAPSGDVERSSEAAASGGILSDSSNKGAAEMSRRAPDAPSSTAPARAKSVAPRPERLGTGHGANETSVAENTTFERKSSSPDEVISIRYDSTANLIAMGVLPPTAIARPRPQPTPFPASNGGFVQDPPRRW